MKQVCVCSIKHFVKKSFSNSLNSHFPSQVVFNIISNECFILEEFWKPGNVAKTVQWASPVSLLSRVPTLQCHCINMVYLPNWKHHLVNSKTSCISHTPCLCSKIQYTQTFCLVLWSPGFLWPIFQSLLIITLPLLGTMSFCGCTCLMIQVGFLWLAWAGRGRLAVNTCRWHVFSAALSWVWRPTNSARFN